MVTRDELILFIYESISDEWIDKALTKDELANGVQFLGADEVTHVTLGVSLNLDFLDQASKIGSNFSIFHHGFDPRTFKSQYSASSQKRLEAIFKNNFTILGWHYALDAHPKLGNNSVIIRELGAKLGEPLFEDWGYTATFSKPQEVKALSTKCSELFQHDVFAVFSGPSEVQTIGVVSGAGKPYSAELAEMEAKGVELFITGEPSESIPHKMKESDINYFACGHYATEVFGIQELGKAIKTHFKDKVEVEFIDIPNPI